MTSGKGTKSERIPQTQCRIQFVPADGTVLNIVADWSAECYFNIQKANINWTS